MLICVKNGTADINFMVKRLLIRTPLWPVYPSVRCFIGSYLGVIKRVSFLLFTTGKNEKVDSLHATAMKFIGNKQLVYDQSPIMLKKLRFFFFFFNVKFGTISYKFYIF